MLLNDSAALCFPRTDWQGAQGALFCVLAPEALHSAVGGGGGWVRFVPVASIRGPSFGIHKAFVIMMFLFSQCSIVSLGTFSL